MLGKNKSAVSGRFWLPGHMEEARDGSVSIEGGTPVIEVVGDLTPAMKQIESTNGGLGVFVPSSDDEADMVVHGRIGDTPSRISVIHGATKNRHRQSLGEFSTQIIGARFCVIGDHVPSIDHRYAAVRLRVDLLEEWATHTGLQTTFNNQEKWVKVDCSLPSDQSLNVESPHGLLGLTAENIFSPPTVKGVEITTKTWLEWNPSEGWTFDRILSEYVHPLRALYSILFGTETFVEELQVKFQDGGAWLPVVGEGIEQGPSRTGEQIPLVYRQETGLELVSGWLGMANRLSPTPQILAGSISQAAGTYLELDTLSLCTAAEGLDRRMRPDARQLSENDTLTTLSLLEDEQFPQKAREILRTAMDIYLWAPSFPMRMESLANSIDGVAPEAVGKINKWKRTVATVRNESAHSLDAGTVASDYWGKMYTINRSLRWVLTAVLLRESGCGDDVLRAGFSRSRKYEIFYRNAQRLVPEVYKNDPPKPAHIR